MKGNLKVATAIKDLTKKTDFPFFLGDIHENLYLALDLETGNLYFTVNLDEMTRDEHFGIVQLFQFNPEVTNVQASDLVNNLINDLEKSLKTAVIEWNGDNHIASFDFKLNEVIGSDIQSTFFKDISEFAEYFDTCDFYKLINKDDDNKSMNRKLLAYVKSINMLTKDGYINSLEELIDFIEQDESNECFQDNLIVEKSLIKNEVINAEVKTLFGVNFNDFVDYVDDKDDANEFIKEWF